MMESAVPHNRAVGEPPDNGSEDRQCSFKEEIMKMITAITKLLVTTSVALGLVVLAPGIWNHQLHASEGEVFGSQPQPTPLPIVDRPSFDKMKDKLSRTVSREATLTAINPKTGTCTASGQGGMYHFKVRSGPMHTLKPGLTSLIKLRPPAVFVQGQMFGPLSWACTGDWSECSCNPGADCASICKTQPVCNPQIPDECTCTGDPQKGGQ